MRSCQALPFLPLASHLQLPPTPTPLLVQEELGAAGLTKRPTSCMLILPKPLKGSAPADDEAKEFAESYAEVRGGGRHCWAAARRVAVQGGMHARLLPE